MLRLLPRGARPLLVVSATARLAPRFLAPPRAPAIFVTTQRALCAPPPPPPPPSPPPPPAAAADDAPKDPWSEVKDDASGQVYWWNKATNETTPLGAAKVRFGPGFQEK
jgi:hypothetical protein